MTTDLLLLYFFSYVKLEEGTNGANPLARTVIKAIKGAQSD